MTIKTFWTILVKILGLWFLFFSLTAIIQLLSLLFMTVQNSNSPGIEKMLLLLGIILFGAGFNFFVFCLLVFKTTWVVEKLKLSQGFTEERFEMSMEWTTILKIATIVIGGVIFIDSFPLLFKQILSVISRGTPISNNPESIWLFFYLVKTVLGYLLMTNSRFVVQLIGRQIDPDKKGGTSDLSTEG